MNIPFAIPNALCHPERSGGIHSRVAIPVAWPDLSLGRDDKAFHSKASCHPERSGGI